MRVLTSRNRFGVHFTGGCVASNGITALMHAAVKGHTSVVELLIAAGADLAAKDTNRGYGRAPNRLAAHRRIRSRACGRGTAIIAAASHGHTRVVELLISGGADLEAKANNG